VARRTRPEGEATARRRASQPVDFSRPPTVPPSSATVRVTRSLSRRKPR
jgi:hypothetical protein